jgi:methylmalonyl-CoA mutase
MDLDPTTGSNIDLGIKNNKDPIYSFKVRDKVIEINTFRVVITLSNPKIALPKYEAWGVYLRWCLQENVPNSLYSDCIRLKREGEDPSVFAGTGLKEQTSVFIM